MPKQNAFYRKNRIKQQTNLFLLIFLLTGCVKEEIKIIRQENLQDKNMPLGIQREIKPDIAAPEPATAAGKLRSNPF